MKIEVEVEDARQYAKPPHAMESLIRLIDALNEWIGRAVSWLTTALVVLVCLDVLSRYLFSRTAAWVL